MQINSRESVGPKSQRFVPLKLISLSATLEWVRRIIKDPLMIVLLVWAFLFVVLGLITAFA